MTNQPLPLEWVNKIFMRLHGRFGNAFFDKFRIGQLNQQGQDIGVENAKIVWSEELSGTTPERIKAALESNYEYAPSCDDFKANCYIRKQVEDYRAITATIDVETQRKNSEKVHAFVAEKLKAKTDFRAWIKPILNNPKAYPDISLKLAKEVEAMQA
jgi:hypothetical protein